MPERQDHTFMDYIYNVQSNTSPVGTLIPLVDTWGWSAQAVFYNGSGTGNLIFQFTDFDGLSGSTFPFPPNNNFGTDTFQLAGSAATYLRTGKAYDPLYNTPKWMRISWNDSGSSVGSRLFLSVTLKHQ